jgi:tryptophanyl-tRNA synthetase
MIAWRIVGGAYSKTISSGGIKMKRILTGDRTTGRLHLGHYVGSLQNRVKLQDEYDTFIILADIQALTTHFERPELINKGIYEVAIDNLSVGLDPNKITMLLQSKVSAIAELTVFYSMLVSVNSLRHNPTIKTEAKQYGYDDLSYGFLGYPVSQTADITFCNADLVPVGEDQLPHIELGKKIVRRFNDLYGKGKTIIVEPQALISNTPRLVGLNGNSKMGKSLGNAIYLSDTVEDVNTKVKSAVTDKNRINIKDKGNPDICTVSKYHEVFNHSEFENICEMCRNANIGCAACKSLLSKKINSLLAPFRERRAYYEEHKNEVRDIILDGSKKANMVGNETVENVKKAMSIYM